MEELKQRAASREPPALWEKLRDTVVGVIIIGGVGFLKYQVGLSDILFGLGLLFGGGMVSKSLAMDFLGAIKDKLS